MKLSAIFNNKKRNWLKQLFLPAMTVVLLLGSGCGKDDSKIVASLQVVSLGKLGTTHVPAGIALPIQARATYQDNHVADVTSLVQWDTSNHALATTSNDAGKKGTVLGVTPGTVTVSASIEGISNELQIQVTDALLQQIEVKPAVKALPKGITQTCTATGTFSDGSHLDITSQVDWSSSNQQIATIDSSGLATLITSGTVTITASKLNTASDNIQGSTTLVITGANLTSIALTTIPAMTTTVPKGFSVEYIATGTYSDGTSLDVTSLANWVSSDPAAISISNASGSKGIATGLQIDTATVSATVNGISGSKTLQVTPATLQSIAVTADDLALPNGFTQQYTATGTFSDGSTLDLTHDANLTWASSSPMVASIDANGLAGLTSPGTTSISATYTGGISGSTSLVVTDAILQSIDLITIPSATVSVAKGVSVQYIAKGHYSDGTIHNITALVSWSSSDLTIATISNTEGMEGFVITGAMGMTTGNTTITATKGTVSQTAPLAVTTQVLTSIDVSAVSSVLANGTTQQYTAIGHYSDGSTADITSSVTWSTGSGMIATVSNTVGSKGVVTGVAVGMTTITATLDTVSGGTVLNVTSASLSSIAVTTIPAMTTSLPKGTNVQLVATGTFSDGTTQDLSSLSNWTGGGMTLSVSNAPGSKGVVTGVAMGGPVPITATVGTTSGSINLSVTTQVLTSIDVTPVGAAIAKGTTQQYTAMGHYSDGSVVDITSSVTWSATDVVGTGVVSFTMTAGQVVGIAVGSANITATLGTVSGSTVLNVTSASLSSIAVTTVPAMTTSLPKGTNVQLVATGTFSDGTTQDLSSLANWTGGGGFLSVSNAAGSKGLATGVAMGGPVAITATVGTTGGNINLTVTTQVLTSIDVTAVRSAIAKGTTQQYTATGHYSDGSTTNITTSVTWSTGSGAVATVSNAMGSKGLVTAVDLGATNIIATLGAVSGSTVLNVTNASLSSIAVTTVPAMTTSLPKGTKVQLVATGTFSDGTTQDLSSSASWTGGGMALSVSNAAGSKGLVTGVAVGGPVAITATVGIISGSINLTVTTQVLTSIDVTPVGAAIAKGTTQQMVATGRYSDGSTADITTSVTWSTGSGAIATVSNAMGSKGLVTGVAVGTTNITATLGAVSGSSSMNVIDAKLVSIAITPSFGGNTVDHHDYKQFIATGTYSDGTTKEVTSLATWSSSTSNITLSNLTGLHGILYGAGSVMSSSVITAAIGSVTSPGVTVTVTP